MFTNLLKIAFVVVSMSASFIICGCQTQEQQQNTTFGAFNDESYVWENYQFTTNRVMETK